MLEEVVGAVDNAGKIDINNADLTELDKLPGIGPVWASDIIFYRDENGGFGLIEELKNISGIGDKTFENIEDMVMVGTLEQSTEIE